MYDYKDYGKDPLKLLIERYGEEYVFRMFLPRIPVGRTICSPLREDKSPSFRISSKNGRIYWTDYSNGDRGNLISFLLKYFNCSYHELYGKVDYSKPVKAVHSNTAPIKYYYEHKSLTTKDYDHWGQYRIDYKLLEKYNVKACSYIYMIKGESNFTFHNELYDKGLCYHYQVEDKHRFYRPLDKGHRKWLGNIYPNYFGSMSNNLIITSSLKDVMVLDYFGYNAIALASESSPLTSNVLQAIRHCNEISLFYDYDKAGIHYSSMLSHSIESLTGKSVKRLFTNNELKDPSDYVKYNKCLPEHISKHR